MKLIVVTGSHTLTAAEREWAEKEIERELVQRREFFGPEIWLYHGDAYGVDQTAEKVAKRLDFECVCAFPAQWEDFGRGAGFRRNKQMIGNAARAHMAGMDVEVLAFFPKGARTAGTAHTLELAEQAGLAVESFVNPRGSLASSS